MSKIDELIAIHLEVINCSARAIEFFEAKNPQVFQKLFMRIWECWTRKEVGCKYKCSAIFNEILALCYCENYKPEHRDSKIQASVDHLLRNYHNYDLTIKETAQKSFVSEVYFRKLFQAHYGIFAKIYYAPADPMHKRLDFHRILLAQGDCLNVRVYRLQIFFD